MHTETIAYEIDGAEHIGYLAVDRDREGTRPGVLVCHEGPGLGDHERVVCEQLADLGYVAFALDYHGGGKVLGRDEMMGILGALRSDLDRTRAVGLAGLSVLTAQTETDASRIAAIGYCFGGTMALELGRAGTDLKAIVGFHSGLGTSRPEDAANITGSVLVNIGADDPMIPPEQRAEFEAEMRAGGVDWQMLVLGGVVHSFTNPAVDALAMPEFIAYNANADQRSWRAMIDLFDTKLGSV